MTWHQRAPRTFTPEVCKFLRDRPGKWIPVKEYPTRNHGRGQNRNGTRRPIHPPDIQIRWSYKGNRSLLEAMAMPVSL